MDDRDQATCPVCGSAAGVRSLGQLMADADRGMDQAIRARAERPPPSGRPVAWTGGSDFADGESGGGGPDTGEALFEFTLYTAVHVLRQTVGKRLGRYYRERLLPEAVKAREAHGGQRLDIAARHPDLRVCVRDQVIFVAGGTRAVRLDRLPRSRTGDMDAALGALAAELRAP